MPRSPSMCARRGPSGTWPRRRGGWGGMVMHAARHYGVRALGVTLSRRQAEWAQKAIAESGLSELAEVRHLDYRDVEETEFDAISSIGLTEHIGVKLLPAYFQFLN